MSQVHLKSKNRPKKKGWTKYLSQQDLNGENQGVRCVSLQGVRASVITNELFQPQIEILRIDKVKPQEPILLHQRRWLPQRLMEKYLRQVQE